MKKLVKENISNFKRDINPKRGIGAGTTEFKVSPKEVLDAVYSDDNYEKLEELIHDRLLESLVGQSAVMTGFAHSIKDKKLYYEDIKNAINKMVDEIIDTWEQTGGDGNDGYLQM